MPGSGVERITLGLLGGGQLGRMFVHAAQRLGMAVVVLDPVPGCPAAQAADRHLCAGYDDPAALDELARLCRAVTTEFENVPARSLAFLAARVPVAPSACAVAVAQDRLVEKRFFRSLGIPTADFFAFPGDTGDEEGPRSELPRGAQPSCDPGGAALRGTWGAAPCDFAFPAILKTRRMGYDGKGQVSVDTPADLAQAWQRLGGVACIVESRLSLHAELSVVVARGLDGEIASFPVIENQHAGGILAVSRMPAGQDPDLLEQARAMSFTIAEALDYHGVLCVEYFVVPSAQGLVLLANEMAPRPHNAGHVTIDVCSTSQFEQQARILAGWPLGDTRQYLHAGLINLLGERWWNASGVFREPPWSSLASLPGAALHLYGKDEARPGRKMGHLTVRAASAAERDARLQEALEVLAAWSQAGSSTDTRRHAPEALHPT